MFSRTPEGDRTLKATSISMKRFAEALSTALGSIVVDQTGIEGTYDVSFQWTPDSSEPRMSKSGEPLPAPPSDAVPGPSIFTALQEKLGLKLESRKVPVEVIVIVFVWTTGDGPVEELWQAANAHAATIHPPCRHARTGARATRFPVRVGGPQRERGVGSASK